MVVKNHWKFYSILLVIVLIAGLTFSTIVLAATGNPTTFNLMDRNGNLAARVEFIGDYCYYYPQGWGPPSRHVGVFENGQYACDVNGILIIFPYPPASSGWAWEQFNPVDAGVAVPVV